MREKENAREKGDTVEKERYMLSEREIDRKSGYAKEKESERVKEKKERHRSKEKERG
jgi:hypothetical protein